MVASAAPSQRAGRRRPPEAPVTLVPGNHFFTDLVTVAPGAAESELAGIAALALEGAAPFPAEQLATGYFGSAAEQGLVVFAGLRRKFAAEQETWRNSLFVVPDFATFLPRGRAEPCIAVLETAACVTVLRYGDGSKLPERIVSRPVPAEPAGEDGIALARDQALARLPADGRRIARFRLAEQPCLQANSRFVFQWEAVEGASGWAESEAAFDATQLWSMDLRDPEFLVGRRRDFQWNRLAWNSLVGVCAAIGLLALGEGALFGGKLWLMTKRDLVTAQAPVVQQTGEQNSMLKKLDAYGRDKPQPLEMLDFINQRRPEPVLFTKFVSEGYQLKISATTDDVTHRNNLETALQGVGELQSATVSPSRMVNGKADFEIVVQFRPGFGARTPVAAPPAGTAAAPAPALGALPTTEPAGSPQPTGPETVTVKP